MERGRDEGRKGGGGKEDRERGGRVRGKMKGKREVEEGRVGREGEREG